MISGVPLMLIFIGFVMFPIGLYLMIKGNLEKHAAEQSQHERPKTKN